MTEEQIDAESLLAIDLGSMHTRASLFDVVDGRYHFIATGTVMSTVDAPIGDASVGIFQAVQALEQICGHKLLIGPRLLQIPSKVDGSGVDRLVLTHSAGPRPKIVLAGLLNGFSLESAERLVASLPGQVLERISLADRRPRAAQLDAILAVKPDLMVISGGTEGGASRSVYDLVELTGLVCRVLHDGSKPRVLYCGNQALAKNIEEFLDRMTSLHIAPNLRPSISQENLGPAMEALGKMITDVRANQLMGFKEIVQDCSVDPMPTAFGFGRMIRFLSQLYDPIRGVMGVDLGSNSLTLAASAAGDLHLRSLPFGMGAALEPLVDTAGLKAIVKWLPMEMAEDDLRDHLYQMTLYPHRVPATIEALAVTQAVARYALQLGVKQLKAAYPGTVMNFEPFLISGSTLTCTPSPMNALSLLLDGLQPVGVTTFVMDQNNLLASLGAAAQTNALLPVQVLESGAFLNLGTVVCPNSTAHSGSDIMRVKIEQANGTIHQFVVKKGSLSISPLRTGENARIHLEGLGRTVIDPITGARSGSYRITGGACGVVIDARGRPIHLPDDDEKRRDLLRKWRTALEI